MQRVPLIVVVAFAAGLSACAAHAETSKLDPFVRSTIAKLRAGASPAALHAAGAAVEPGGALDVFIVGSASRAALEAAGARVRTALPGVCTAFVPIDALERIAELPTVSHIAGSVQAEAELNASVSTTNAAAQRSTGPAFDGANGAGVLIGIVDTGVSLTHGDFDDASGNTRLVRLWDQTASGTPPLGYLYGVECSAAQIDAGTCPQTALDGHGTHVMSIAAGDGSLTGGGVPAHTYVGVAPRADLIAVKTTFSTTAIVDGVNYIFDVASSRGQNAVVNLSLGSQAGPHDGTSPFEAALDALTGTGRIIVKSAGNDRIQAVHAERIAGAGDTVATMTVSGSVVGRLFQIDGYYASTENLRVTIVTPGGTTVGPIMRGLGNGPIGQNTPDGQVIVENGIFQTSTGAYEVFIDVTASSGDDMNGTWAFHFTPQSLGPANGEVDLWRFARSSGLTANFVIGNQIDEQVSEPGNAQSLITVAAWVSTQAWIACSGQSTTFGQPPVGNLASFSSAGPTRDGRPKPDITAPATAIGAARTLDLGAVCSGGPSVLLGDGLNHIMMSGTSMAAPHVAGVAALLMQKLGALTPADIKNHLIAHALTDGFTGAVWNQDWGAGKLRVGDLTDPSATVLAPDGGESYPIGATVELQWSTSDAFGGVTEVDLLLSRTGPSGPFETIALSETNDGSYNWTATAPGTHAGGAQGFDAYLKVVARDDAGNSGEDVSAGFSIFDPVATLVALFLATPLEAAVELRWQFGEPRSIVSAIAERAASAVGPWAPLGTTPEQDGGVMVMRDVTAEPGRLYHYRLVVITQGGLTHVFGPVTGMAGGAIPAFALAPLAPNPTRGATRIAFSVARAAPIRLSIVDVQGREVVSLAEGVHVPGRYELAWSGETGGARAPAGLYFVRYETPGTRVVRRLAVVR